MGFKSSFKKNLEIFLPVFIIIILFFSFSYLGLYFFEGEQIREIGFLKAIYYILLSSMGEQPFDASSTGGVFVLIMIMVFGVFILIHVLDQVSGNVIEERFNHVLNKNRYIPKRISDHVIIVGYNPLSKQIISELQSLNEKIVILADNISSVERDELKKDKIGYVIANPIDYPKSGKSSPFSKSVIKRAKSVILTLEKQADNAFLCLTAKDQKPDLRVVSHSLEYDVNTLKKFQKAGADMIISSNVVGGRLLAMSGIRPDSTEFIQDISDSSYGIDLFELEISSTKQLDKFKENVGGIRDYFGLTIIGLKKHSGDIEYSSKFTDVGEGDVLIIIGSNTNFNSFINHIG